MAEASQTYSIGGGVHCADFIGRDKHIQYGFSAGDVERLIDRMLDFLKAGAVFVREEDGVLRAEWNGEALAFRPNAAQALAGRRNEKAYLLSLTVNQDYRVWATDFISLGAQVDKRRALAGLDLPLEYCELRLPPPGAGPEAQVTSERLENITDALEKHDAFIILGEPGGGKTTTLQKMAYDHALACLEKRCGQTPLFVRLSQQREMPPFDFLDREWKKHTGGDFADALAAGRALLLLDGVNELPREKRAGRLNDWRLFVKDDCANCKVVFSGREKDYEGYSLDLPRVRIEPLDGERIAGYLRRNQAEGLLDLINKETGDERRRLRGLAENPLNLVVLAGYFRAHGQSLANRGDLFGWFAGALMAREKRNHPDDTPLEVRCAALEKLAFAAQERGETTALPPAKARAITPASVDFQGEPFAVDAGDLFHFARGAKILDPGAAPDVRFTHQLLQEYFAARELLRYLAEGEDLSGLWRAKRTVEEMPEAEVGEWDALPDPPATGWEVTTILAAGLARDPAGLVEAVRPYNPALAGRCLDEAGVQTAGEALEHARERVRADLLADLENPRVHLRARLQAGHVLGRVGDPRFVPQVVNGVEAILPGRQSMADVPAGTYPLGSAEADGEAYSDERPPCSVSLEAFAIGKWPVTNAEYACFMRAGGYNEEQYWQTDLARRWLKGEEVTGGQLRAIMDDWQYMQDNPDWKQQVEGIWPPKNIQAYENLAGLSEQEVKTQYGQALSRKSRSRPAYWDDARYNNPSQPVVGVTWFEACAYCAWLSALSGRTYRLPSEAEWEAAARGARGLKYPWGDDWDAARANTLEGRALRPTPVGAYAAAGGVGPFGAQDQAGNVWEWTGSLYLLYPYDARKSEDAGAEGERVLRGGSWDFDRGVARCADRSRDVPDIFNYDVGFRLVSPGIFLDSGS